ncbi:MAG: T9SS C-terminal target domain-containing protein [Balneolaceae bacterium]|nr:MAG: T9SS C-terminal target domain-containing protein [Balneolaceae bacterium]
MPALTRRFGALLASMLMAASGLAGPAASQDVPQIVINEVQASNRTTIADEDGDYEDWVELYNAGPGTVDLNGYGLSDDATRLWRWVFPQGTTIAPGEFLLVWASGKDRRIPGEPLHTSFRIRSEGEEVLLSSFTVPDGQDTPVIDRLAPTPIPTDYSFGRYPDGADQWRLFDTPTPGASNRESPWQGIADPPVFSHRPGFYTDALELVMDAGHPDAVIHYTTDGSVPTTASPVYEGPVLIDRRDHEPDRLTGIRTGPQFWQVPSGPVFKGHVIRAISVREGYRNSEAATGTWFIHPEGAGRYSFPVIALASDREHFFSDETGIMVPGDTFDPDEIVSSGNYNERGDAWERPAHMTFFDMHADPFAHHRSGYRDVPVDGALAGGDIAAGSGGDAASISHGGDIAAMPGTHAAASVSGGGNDPGNVPLQGFSQNVGVRIHGGATRRYPQKSLRIYARSAYDWSPEISWPLFPGLRKAGSDEPLETWKRFILRSSGDDWFHTMFKDAMIQSLYADRRVDQQAYRPAVVFINGEYWGIHNIRERFDGWYVELNYDIHRDDVGILVDNAALNHGTEEDRQHYLAMRDFAAVMDLSQPEHYAHMKTQMDVDNYLAYKTFLTYTANADWPHNNIRYWRKRTAAYQPDAPYGRDGRWRWMIFDLDASFGFPYEGDAAGWAQYDHDTIEWITGIGNPRVPQAWVNQLFNNLIENETFRHRFLSLLAGDLNTRFQPEFVAGRIEEFQDVYAPEIEEHRERYYYSAGRTPEGWQDHIAVMKEFAQRRPGYLRSFVMEHFDIADTARLELNVPETGGGYVAVGGIPIHKNTPGVPEDHSRWTGTYFDGVPVTLEAVPEKGWSFLEWRDVSGQPFDFDEISVGGPVESGEISVGGPVESGEISFTWIPEGDLVITAVFEQDVFTHADPDEQQPARFRLHQNYPNPFNNQTTISYDLPERAAVTIEIHSVTGRLVKRVDKGLREPGSHSMRLDTRGMASGVYLYRMLISSHPNTGMQPNTGPESMAGRQSPATTGSSAGPGSGASVAVPPKKMILIR